jgi:hypothetical protein
MRKAAYIAGAILILGIAWNWGDLRRYIKIEMM